MTFRLWRCFCQMVKKHKNSKSCTILTMVKITKMTNLTDLTDLTDLSDLFQGDIKDSLGGISPGKKSNFWASRGSW